ncbi:hypothetical protein HED60_12630 [Planctomycetales bacterium ZRK34]|nr:hypothetical protein HED60_12630 [Planctomycetales bacterium ZRK34]
MSELLVQSNSTLRAAISDLIRCICLTVEYTHQENRLADAWSLLIDLNNSIRLLGYSYTPVAHEFYCSLDTRELRQDLVICSPTGEICRWPYESYEYVVIQPITVDKIDLPRTFPLGCNPPFNYYDANGVCHSLFVTYLHYPTDNQIRHLVKILHAWQAAIERIQVVTDFNVLQKLSVSITSNERAILRALRKSHPVALIQVNISVQTGLSPRTIWECLKHLREQGLTHRPHGERKGDVLTEQGLNLIDYAS